MKGKHNPLYCSWIPTVTGKLSFTIIGKTSWPRSCLHLNEIDERGKGIFLQERFCHDFLAPFLKLSDRTKDWIFGWRLGKRLKPLKGRHFFWCVVDGIQKDDEGKADSFSGKIYVIPATKDGIAKFKKFKKDILTAKSKDIDGRIIAINQMIPEYSEVSLIHARFLLHRNGKFSLEQPETKTIKDFGLLQDKDAIERYCALMFSFIRDIAHNHQHHDGENDLIIRLHRCDPDKPDDWIDQVFFDLFRRVIAFKRVRSPFHITNATGILAYVRAFRELFKPPAGNGGFCEKATIQSLETAQYELQMKQSLNSNRLSFIQAEIFGFLALIVGLSGFATFLSDTQKKEISLANFLVQTIKFGAERPLPALVIIISASFFIYSIFGFTKPELKGHYKDGLRVLNGLPKWISVSLLLLLGVGALVAAWGILFFLAA